MGDSASTAGGPSMHSYSQEQEDGGSQYDATKYISHLPQQQRTPFHSQFDVVHSQSHPQQQHMVQYASSPYNMTHMVNALPHQPVPTTLRSPYEHNPGSTIVSSTNARQMQPPNIYRGMQSDRQALRPNQHQQYYVPPQHYLGEHSHVPMQQRLSPVSAQMQDAFNPMYHSYGPPAVQYSAMNFAPHSSSQIHAPLPLDIGIPHLDFHQYAQSLTRGYAENNPYLRRASEPAPVPNFPRGPPRKPKQSGHALWVGNLPPAATVTDLKDHFSRDATKDIESLFLISKSNCAFVNYRTEAACVAAMNRFHDSRFHGVRLVCRLRRGSASTTAPASELTRSQTSEESLVITSIKSSNVGLNSPVIVGQPKSDTKDAQDTKPNASDATVVDNEGDPIPEKYFIVKSLTVQDLEASVRNGIWATQSHNETALNEAYEKADNVYLVFSANKSGEYFGYARMKSPIAGEPINLSSVTEIDEAKQTGTPQSIPTTATETAPKGRIIDDSARGTIFWEADHSDNDDEESPKNKGSNPASASQNWGRQFEIEWMSTSRLPFFRTRGLRNPWNANREVKIARDGTELEPSVGRKLVQMFHRPPPPGPAVSSTTMPSYR